MNDHGEGIQLVACALLVGLVAPAAVFVVLIGLREIAAALWSMRHRGEGTE